MCFSDPVAEFGDEVAVRSYNISDADSKRIALYRSLGVALSEETVAEIFKGDRFLSQVLLLASCFQCRCQYCTGGTMLSEDTEQTSSCEV